MNQWRDKLFANASGTSLTDVPMPMAVVLWLLHLGVAGYYLKQDWASALSVLLLNVLVVPGAFLCGGFGLRKLDPEFKLMNAYYMGLALTLMWAMALFRNQ